MVKWVVLLLSIQEALDSNCSPQFTKTCHTSPQSLLANAATVPQPCQYTSFPIHHSLSILTHNVTV